MASISWRYKNEKISPSNPEFRPELPFQIRVDGVDLTRAVSSIKILVEDRICDIELLPEFAPGACVYLKGLKEIMPADAVAGDDEIGKDG